MGFAFLASTMLNVHMRTDWPADTGISIVVPVFNEAGTILGVLNDIDSFVKREQLTAEITVVNDGSTDETMAVLRKVEFITLLEHKMNRGYSTSLKTGISKAKYEWILTIDGDGSHPASQISALLPFAGDYDLVVGARDGKLGHDTFFRRFGRGIVTIFAEYVCQSKIADINSGFRLFKKELALKFWHLFPEGFSFSTTLTVAAHVRHYPVKYVFTEVHKRQGGKSSIKPAKDFIGFLNIITRLAIYFRPLRVFVPLGIFFFVAAIAIVSGSYVLTGMSAGTTFTVLVTTGVQMLVLGLIAEMIVKRFFND